MTTARQTHAMYCRQCGYELAGLSQNRCPECGRPFDPANPRTFRRHPQGWLLRLWLRRVALGLVALVVLSIVSLLATMVILHSRYKAQERSVAAVRQAGGRVSVVRSSSKLLVTLFGFRTNRAAFDSGPGVDRPGLFGTRFAYLTDRAVHVQLIGNPTLTNSDDWQDLPIDDAWLANLQGLPYVRIIELASPYVTDAGLEYFDILPYGGTLSLRCPKLSSGAVEQLERRLRLARAAKLHQPPEQSPCQ